MNSVEEVIGYANFSGIGDFVFLLVQTLNRVDSTRFYDLPVLESTLDCLSHLTYGRGWSLQYNGSGEELCSLMANVFIQVCESCTSFSQYTKADSIYNKCYLHMIKGGNRSAKQVDGKILIFLAAQLQL